MKKAIVFFLLLSLTRVSLAQKPTPMIAGHIDSIYSSTLNEQRALWIYVPPYDTEYFSKPSFPVLYVLDGDAYFPALITIISALSEINDNSVLPPMIVVGIPNSRGHRNRDLTPFVSKDMPGSGGGEAFTAFLEKEVIPYIDKTYPTAPYRVLTGHSLGGLMVVNTLLKHPSLFNAYAPTDPSMFFANEKLLLQSDTLLQQAHLQGRSLFLAVANTMPEGLDTASVRTDTTELTHHIRAILQLSDHLKKYSADSLRWAYKYYPDDDHHSLPTAAHYDALRFIFSSNRFPRNQPMNQYFDKTISPDSMQTLIHAHYQQVSKERGYAVKPPEATINQFGYIFLSQKDYPRSKMFFATNIEYYPNSFNTYDGMGDYYAETKDKKMAITYYRKALALKHTEEIQTKLDKLLAAK